METGALMCPKGANMFSGNEFCRIWDIRQNNLRQTGALMCPKGANMFFGNEFCRFRDIRQNIWEKNINR
jgi:hypothetical protein